ncbi:MAG: hypothetical protein IT340_17315, partial [Chloroflexi bacterium]|nr:hypothetical protein [Chloroflexota bacterium]
YLMGHLTVGHLNVAALLWLPLFAVALLAAGDRRRFALPAAAVCLFMTAMTEWHTTLFALVLGGLLGLWALLGALWRRAGWARPARMAAAGLLGGLLLAPLVVATAQAVHAAGARAELGERWAQEHSANLLAFLLPQDLHPLWGDAVLAWRKANIEEVLSEGRVSLGLIVMVLAAIGVVGLRWRAAPWLAAAGVGIALALGPEVHIGTVVRSAVTPFDILSTVPLVDVSRTPARFSVLATLGLAVLSAAGVREIARRLPPRAVVPVIALLGALVVAEFLTAPFDLERPPDTALARQIGQKIAEIDPQGTVLTLPYRQAEQERVFHQVQHERPIFGGFIPREVERPFRTNTPGFVDLGTARPLRDIFEAMPDPLAVLNYFHVRYVLVYRGEVLDDAPGRALLTSLRRVLRQSAPALTSADGALEAWGVPPAALTEPFMRADRGWWPVETIPQLGRTRWMGERSLLVLERPRLTPVTVEFTAVSYQEPRRIEVRAGDRVLDVVTVTPAPHDFVVTVPADLGSTHLTLTSLDGVDSPALHGNEHDQRDLSVAVARVRLITEPPTVRDDDPVHPVLADATRALAG